MAQMDMMSIIQQQLTGGKRPGVAPLPSGSGEQQVRTQSAGASGSGGGTYVGNQFIPEFTKDDFEWVPGMEWIQEGYGDNGGTRQATAEERDAAGGWNLKSDAISRYFPGWTSLNGNNWEFGIQGDKASGPDLKNLMVKSAEKEGTTISFERQGDKFVPTVTGTKEWDTNSGDMNKKALMGVAMLATAGAASHGLLGAGAQSAFGGIAAPAAGSVPGVVAGSMSIPGVAGTTGMSTIPALAGGTAGATIAPAAGGGFSLSNLLTGAGDFLMGSGTGPAGAAGRASGGFLGLLGGINNLGGGSSRSGTSGSSTETKKTDLSPEAIMEIVRRMMEDPNMGLQSIMNPAQGAGTFGGSNQALLVSNLINRAASTAALASAPTTTTSNASSSGQRNDDTFIEELLKKWF